MFDLRAWLRRAPKPKRLRIKTVDGEEQIIELSGNRYLWNEIVNTLRSAEAVSVQCLDAEGGILRAMKLMEDEGGGASHEDKSATRVMAQQAAMLDRFGLRIAEAYEAGARASSGSQDKLVELVEVLCNHLSIAVTNINNLSVNLSNALQSAGGEDASPNAGLLQAAVAMMTGRAPVMTPPPVETPPNGKGRKHP